MGNINQLYGGGFEDRQTKLVVYRVPYEVRLADIDGGPSLSEYLIKLWIRNHLLFTITPISENDFIAEVDSIFHRLIIDEGVLSITDDYPVNITQERKRLVEIASYEYRTDLLREFSPPVADPVTRLCLTLDEEILMQAAPLSVAIYPLVNRYKRVAFVEPQTREVLPREVLPHMLEVLSDSTECPICRVLLKTGPIMMTQCQHFFHRECLADWRKIGNTCPICRQ